MLSPKFGDHHFLSTSSLLLLLASLYLFLHTDLTRRYIITITHNHIQCFLFPFEHLQTYTARGEGIKGPNSSELLYTQE